MLIGRSSSCALPLHGDSVSAEHAVVFFDDCAWYVRDLGSTNGTWFDGKRILAGEPHRLFEGSELAFGEVTARWRIVDVGPAGAAARCIDTGEWTRAVEGLLQLPCDSATEMTLHFDEHEGQWLAETEGSIHPVRDQSVVQVGERSYLLELPPLVENTERTRRGGEQTLSLEAGGLSFVVSRDEEHVDMMFEHPSKQVPLPPRSFHYLLVTLARRRLKESEDAPSEQGWMHVEELMEQLRVTRQKLNLDISRARRQLAEAGIQHAVSLIERRPQSAQVRLGVGRVSVHQA